MAQSRQSSQIGANSDIGVLSAENGLPISESERKRVLFAREVFPVPSETFLVNLVIGLLNRKWDLNVLCGRFDQANVQLFPSLAAIPDLKDRIIVSKDWNAGIRGIKPQLVHFYFGDTALGHLLACKTAGAKTIVSFLGHDVCILELEQPDYYSEVWSHASVIHTSSEALWARAQERGCPVKKVHQVIYFGIDTRFFDPGEINRADEVGTDLRPLRLLSVGRFEWEKGHQYSLKAVRLLVDGGIHCEFRIIGDGSHRPAIVHEISDVGLSDIVHLAGRADQVQVKKAMEWADIFVHSSVSEGFGLVVTEAQAMKLPVVVSNAEGLPENVVDGITGFVVPRRDPQAIAGRILQLVNDASLRKRLGEAGRRHVQQEFEMSNQHDRFSKLYEETIDGTIGAALLSNELKNAGGARFERDEFAVLKLEMGFVDRATARHL